MAWQTVETIPISVAASIAPQRADAVRVALLNRALPLARMVYGRAEPLATASLVADGATLALLTAAHVFEHVATGDLVVPLPREGAWACLRSARARVIADADRDIALIIIGDPAVARRLRANWTPVEPSQLHLEPRDGRATRLYVMAGYPVIDAAIVAGLADKTIFVVQWGATPRELVQNSIQQISKHKRIGGVVLNSVVQDRAKKYGGEYYYGKSYERYYSES